MKFKSLFLLFIFSCSLVPLKPVEAEETLQRSPEDAVALMYISEAVLLNEIVDDETSSTSKMSASTKPDVSSDETTDLINQMINATKQQRNDHDRKCRETVEIYRQQGKTCEVDQTNAYCKSKRAELTAKIAALRKKRGGDERKWFTKQWHGIKRAGARFWHKVGPLGRKFLREVGPQALKIVQAGGPGTEALLKKLLKHTAKNMFRQRAKQIGIQALQRILRVQIDVAAAAGVDICEEDEEKTEGEEEEAKSSEVEDKEELPVVTASGTLSEGMSEGSNAMGTTFQLTADFSAGTINGTLKGSRTSTPRGWMNCYNPADPSTELDRIDVNTTDSYEVSFSGSIDKETGEFSIPITPTVQTSATKVSLFTHEECLDKNSIKYPGEGGWNGKGNISGGVSKDGGIEFSTSWTYSWFYAEIEVNGSWSGNGTVASPGDE